MESTLLVEVPLTTAGFINQARDSLAVKWAKALRKKGAKLVYKCGSIFANLYKATNTRTPGERGFVDIDNRIFPH